MSILVTGCAGFIGFHTSKFLLERGENVIGIDNLNDYYDVSLKKKRLKILQESIKENQKIKFSFYKFGLENEKKIRECFKENKIKIVINLAAQAGVRYSIDNPHLYAKSNIIGFLNILEASKDYSIEHLVYASTSSVYGAITSLPFKENIPADYPIQFYAATKRANELMAHSYSHLFNLPTTGLRFFTVYGPWGRPDMALFKFVKSILEEKKIQIFNNGNHQRDFTYIDDIVDGIVKVAFKQPKSDLSWIKNPSPDKSSAPFRIFNIGNNTSVNLLDFIKEIELQLGKKAKKKFVPLQKGDVKDTLSDISSISSYTNYKPKTSYKEGIKKFIEWYLDYYK
tara:strand:+ start:5773 stop:6792 length:1020 start_codon:yes stop_codon:yes gene_type:complete